MTKTFLTQPEHIQTTFEKKYLEMMGDHQERRIDLPGLSPQLIAKNTELENIRAELAQAVKDQEKWDADLEENKMRLNEQRLNFEQVEIQNQEILKRLKIEINKYVDEAKKQLQITRTFEQEYEELVEKEETLQKTISQYKQEIAVLQPYADFFEEIVNNGSMFGTTENILNRYKALTIAKEDCATNLQKLISNIKAPNADLKEELEILKNKKIEMAHSVSQIKEEINKLSKQNRYVQMNLIKDVERVDEKKCELAMIKASINNLKKRILSTENKLGQIYVPDDWIPLKNTIDYSLILIETRYQDLLAVVEPDAHINSNKNKNQRPKTTQGKKRSTFKPTKFESQKANGSKSSRRPGKESTINSLSTSKQESLSTPPREQPSPSTSRRLSTKNSIQAIPHVDP